jgi:hypothetical protein
VVKEEWVVVELLDMDPELQLKDLIDDTEQLLYSTYPVW